jgi:hypothetical protein
MNKEHESKGCLWESLDQPQEQITENYIRNEVMSIMGIENVGKI